MVAGVRLELRRYSLAAKCGYDLVRSRCNVAQKSARGLRFLAAKREIRAVDWAGEWRLGGKVREIGIPKRARSACDAGEGRRVECCPGGEKPCKRVARDGAADAGTVGFAVFPLDLGNDFFFQQAKLVLGASRKGGIVGKQTGAFPRRKVVVPAGGFDGDKRERRTADVSALVKDVEAIPVINMQVNDVIEAVAVVADTVGVVDTVAAAAVADMVVSRVTVGVVAVVLFAALASAIARVARRLCRPNGDARSLNIKREEGRRGIFGTGRSRIRG